MDEFVSIQHSYHDRCHADESMPVRHSLFVWFANGTGRLVTWMMPRRARLFAMFSPHDCPENDQTMTAE
jgi:hypothetical protein